MKKYNDLPYYREHFESFLVQRGGNSYITSIALTVMLRRPHDRDFNEAIRDDFADQAALVCERMREGTYGIVFPSDGVTSTTDLYYVNNGDYYRNTNGMGNDIIFSYLLPKMNYPNKTALVQTLIGTTFKSGEFPVVKRANDLQLLIWCLADLYNHLYFNYEFINHVGIPSDAFKSFKDIVTIDYSQDNHIIINKIKIPKRSLFGFIPIKPENKTYSKSVMFVSSENVHTIISKKHLYTVLSKKRKHADIIHGWSVALPSETLKMLAKETYYYKIPRTVFDTLRDEIPNEMDKLLEPVEQLKSEHDFPINLITRHFKSNKINNTHEIIYE